MWIKIHWGVVVSDSDINKTVVYAVQCAIILSAFLLLWHVITGMIWHLSAYQEALNDGNEFTCDYSFCHK